MSKEFRPRKIDEAQLLPPRVQDYVPPDHLSRLVVTLVREELDPSAITSSYKSVPGQPPFDPRMMTALLLQGYASGIYSSRQGGGGTGRLHDDCGGGPAGLPHPQRVSKAAPAGAGGVVRAGFEAGRKGRSGKARPCRAGWHQARSSSPPSTRR